MSAYPRRVAPVARVSVLRTWVATLFLAAIATGASSARADAPCIQDSDCTKGFTCQTVGISGGCAKSGIATPCPTGQTCDPVAPVDAGAVDCPPAQVVKACEPGACTTDADCATGMVCHADTLESCSSPACAPNQVCDAATSCTNIVAPSACIPKYDLPCTTDSDCGDHFKCVAEQEEACWGGAGSSGGGGVVSADGGEAIPPTGINAPAPAEDAGSAPSSGCVAIPTGVSICQALAIGCTTDADCPSTWTCVTPPSASPGIACAAPAEIVDGGAVAPPCASVPGPVVPPQSMCQPPYTDRGVSPGVGFSDGSGATGNVGSSGSSGGSGSSTSVPSTAESQGATSPKSMTTGGCQMSGVPGGFAPGSLLALASLLGLAFRRRT